MSELSRCRQCETVFREEPGDAQLCDSCREAQYPAIEGGRAKKWSPLQLGLFSLVCDVMMIPSVLTIVRAVGELREVTRREKVGIWRAEHERVRTGAVFGLLAAAARPAILGLLIVVGLAAPRPDPRAPFGTDDELTEIFERLEAEDDDTRFVAARHLREVASTWGTAEVSRALGAARASHDREAASHLLVASLSSPSLPRFETIRDLYPRVDRRGRGTLLMRAVIEGTPDSIEGMLDLVEGDARDFELDGANLAAHPEHAATWLPRLLDLPDEHPGHWLGIEAAHSLCERGAAHAALRSRESTLLFHWASARDRWLHPDPEDPLVLIRATDAVRVLGCLDGPAVGPVLADATALDQPAIATAALGAMLDRGDSVPNATIARLATAPRSRQSLVLELARRDALGRMPAATRTSRAIADGWVEGADPPWTHVGVERRRFGERELDVHVYENGRPTHDGGRIAIGPFADGEHLEPVFVRSRDQEDPSASALADAVARDWVGGVE